MEIIIILTPQNSCRGEMRGYIKSTVHKGWTVVSMWRL